MVTLFLLRARKNSDVKNIHHIETCSDTDDVIFTSVQSNILNEQGSRDTLKRFGAMIFESLRPGGCMEEMTQIVIIFYKTPILSPRYVSSHKRMI